MSLHIVGCTVVDLLLPSVSQLPKWPEHTEFTPSNLVLLDKPPIVTIGGNGANAAYIAARCGAQVTLHSRIGNDALGTLARTWLQQGGCHLPGTVNSLNTAINITASNSRQQRATFFYPGAKVRMPAFSREQKPHLLVCGWPHPPLEAMRKTFQTVRRQGGFTSLDAGPILERPWSLRSLTKIFTSLDLFLANEYEILSMTRSSGLKKATSEIRRYFEGDILVKQGGRGAIWIPAGTGRHHVVKGRRVKVVNTVGAGDSFNGALLAALERGSDFPAATAAACKVAASVVASRRGVLGARCSDRLFKRKNG